MKAVPYASAVESLQYAQVCTRPDLAFVTGILDRYQTNPGIEHWRMVKKALRYVQGTKGLMLTYRRSESLHIEGYTDSYYTGTVAADLQGRRRRRAAAAGRCCGRRAALALLVGEGTGHTAYVVRH